MIVADRLPLQRRLDGCRVLVVEDDFLLANDLSGALRDLGAKVIGPAPTLLDGLLMLVAGGRIDVALMDINLRGEMAYPLADILLDRGVEVVLATGFDPAALPERYGRLPRVEKPFDATKLALALPEIARACRSAPGQPGRFSNGRSGHGLPFRP